MAPSLNNSRNLALQPNLLLLTKCNAIVAVKAGHFWRLGVTMRNLKIITDVIVLNIPQWTISEHCREWYKCEIDFPRHTHTPSYTTAQLVDLGMTVGGHLGSLGSAASNRLLYACMPIYEWHVISCESNNGHQKYMSSKVIGLHVQNMLIILGRIVNMFGNTYTTTQWT